MKKLMTLMLGLTLTFGTVAMALGQTPENPPKTEKKKKKSKKKEAAPKKEGTTTR